MIKEFIPFAHSLADEAGEIARKYFKQPLAVQKKSDASPVTQADCTIEAVLRVHITRTYPTHGIFGEEEDRTREDAEYEWVIDPIDGTRAFIAQQPTFTTLIALCKHGVPILGLIDQPIRRERWFAAPGHPTTLNEKPVTAALCENLSQARLSTTSLDLLSPEGQKIYERLQAQCATSQHIPDAYGYAMLASGKIDVILEEGLKPYDFCALIPIIEGAGGRITDWDGKPLTLKSEGKVLATSKFKQPFSLVVHTS